MPRRRQSTSRNRLPPRPPHRHLRIPAVPPFPILPRTHVRLRRSNRRASASSDRNRNLRKTRSVRISSARRNALQVEVATAEALISEREGKWQKSLAEYGRRYPKSVEKQKARKPSFVQNLFSFGAAGRMFAATQSAFAELNDARSLRRRKEHDDEELDDLQRRALAKLESNLKEHANAQTMNEKFLARPGNAALAKESPGNQGRARRVCRSPRSREGSAARASRPAFRSARGRAARSAVQRHRNRGDRDLR